LYLQVSKLGELLAAVVKLAGEWFDLLVHDLVCPDVTTLRKCLATDVALVRTFTGVASFVCLVASLVAVWLAHLQIYKP
jgi:hypothetical protein